MNDSTYMLPSGQTITAEDYSAMRKQIVKDTLKNVAATVGIIAIGGVVLGWLKSRNPENTTLED